MVVLTGEYVLEGREPVRVDDDERVRAGVVEPLAQAGESGDERRVAAAAEPDPLLLGQHDRRLVADDRGADELTHRAGPAPRRPVTAGPRARGARARAPSGRSWPRTPGRTARTGRCARPGRCPRSPRPRGTAGRARAPPRHSHPAGTGRAAAR